MSTINTDLLLEQDQDLSEYTGIFEVQDPSRNVQETEKFANNIMKNLTEQSIGDQRARYCPYSPEDRSALYAGKQPLLEDLLKSVIAVAKAPQTSSSTPGLLVRFVCFCDAQLTSFGSQECFEVQGESYGTSYHKEIQNILYAFVSSCGMDTEQFLSPHMEHTVLHSFLSNSPHSLYILSKCTSLSSYHSDGDDVPISISMLRAVINKWHPRNSLLNLQLASQLFELWEMKETTACDLLEESYRFAVTAAGSALKRLQLSLPEGGADDLPFERREEVTEALLEEQSAAPALYQEATQLVCRIESVRARRRDQHDELETYAPSTDSSYRQYLRGIHWMPSQATYAYLKEIQ